MADDAIIILKRRVKKVRLFEKIFLVPGPIRSLSLNKRERTRARDISDIKYRNFVIKIMSTAEAKNVVFSSSSSFIVVSTFLQQQQLVRIERMQQLD